LNQGERKISKGENRSKHKIEKNQENKFLCRVQKREHDTEKREKIEKGEDT